MALPRPIVALDILHDGPSVRAEARRRKVNDPDRQKDVQRAARAYKSPQRKCYLWAKAHGSLIHSLRPGQTTHGQNSGELHSVHGKTAGTASEGRTPRDLYGDVRPSTSGVRQPTYSD